MANAKNVESTASPYRGQLVEAGEEFVESHHQLLRSALGRQAGEALDVGEQDAAGTQEDTREELPLVIWRVSAVFELPELHTTQDLKVPFSTCFQVFFIFLLYFSELQYTFINANLFTVKRQRRDKTTSINKVI